jgi:hypothetical protein
MQSRVREYAEADSSLAVLSGEIERALRECALAGEKAVFYHWYGRMSAGYTL